MIHEALYSSRSKEWPTPEDFFCNLDVEFHFTLDPCATAQNAKCARFFTKSEDGLSKERGTHVVFCNPPYGKQMRSWARKCYQASLTGALVVLLAHARTDTRWFHDWVYGKADAIRFGVAAFVSATVDRAHPFLRSWPFFDQQQSTTETANGH